MTSPSQCESASNFLSLCRSHWRAISTSETPPEQEVSSRKVAVAMEAPNITKYHQIYPEGPSGNQTWQ